MGCSRTGGFAGGYTGIGLFDPKLAYDIFPGRRCQMSEFIG